jgi:transposase
MVRSFPRNGRRLYPDWIYNNRSKVGRLWARLKEGRAVATRYEKTAASFLGVLCLAATLDWIRR